MNDHMRDPFDVELERLRAENPRLKAEIARLRKLVERAFYEGIKSERSNPYSSAEGWNASDAKKELGE